MTPRSTVCALLLVLALQTAAFADLACQDIAKVDLANATLQIPGERKLAFTDGVSCPADYGAAGSCEFEYRIALDLLLTPEPDVHLRMIVVDEDHARGSGANSNRLIAYRCDRGLVRPVFSERFEGGASVMRAFGTKLVLLARGPNPLGRPSTKLYVWSTKEGTYKVDPISGGDRYPPADNPGGAGVLQPR
jgi:hypothetical protein